MSFRFNIKNRALFFWVLSSALVFPLQAHAWQCLVLSGKYNDHNLALFGEPLLEEDKAYVDGKKCEIFPSLGHLRNHIFGDGIDPPKVKPGETLVIVQATHGGPGGSAACTNNAGHRSSGGDDILTTLRQASANHRIGFVSSACYSGDLVKRQLIQDYLEPTNETIGKLCILTGALFGRVLYDAKAYDLLYDNFLKVLTQSKKGDSLEALFRRGDKGLISSAPWNQAGVTQAFLDRGMDASVRLLHGLSWGVSHCPSVPDRDKAQVCLSPAFDDVEATRLLPEFRGLWARARGIDGVSATNKPPSDYTAFVRQQIEDLRKSGKVLKDIQPDVLTWERLKVWEADLDRRAKSYRGVEDPPVEECVKRFKRLVLQRLRERHPKDLPNFYELIEQWQTINISPFYIPNCGPEILYPETDKTLKAAVLAYYEQPASLRALRGRDIEAHLKQFDNLPVYSKHKMIASILGEHFFGCEFKESVEDGKIKLLPYDQTGTTSPSHTLNTFMRGSLEIDKFADPVDQAHRDACRGIKIGEDTPLAAPAPQRK